MLPFFEFPLNYGCCSYVGCLGGHLCAKMTIALNVCFPRNGPNGAFQWVVFRRVVGGPRSSSDGNGHESIRTGRLNKREASGPIRVLVRSIHFRDIFLGKTHIFVSFIFCFCGATLLYACQNLRANL